jgi:hypothetical protein
MRMFHMKYDVKISTHSIIFAIAISEAVSSNGLVAFEEPRRMERDSYPTPEFEAGRVAVDDVFRNFGLFRASSCFWSKSPRIIHRLSIFPSSQQSSAILVGLVSVFPAHLKHIRHSQWPLYLLATNSSVLAECQWLFLLICGGQTAYFVKSKGERHVLQALLNRNFFFPVLLIPISSTLTSASLSAFFSS